MARLVLERATTMESPARRTRATPRLLYGSDHRTLDIRHKAINQGIGNKKREDARTRGGGYLSPSTRFSICSLVGFPNLDIVEPI